MNPHRARVADALLIGLPFAAAGVGGVVTARAIPTWYRGLDKPPWNPPDWVFGPVWTVLYLMMGIAAVLVRRQAEGSRGAQAMSLYGLQLGLNLGWSLVFFGARDVRAAVGVIALLWLAIVATIAAFGRVDRRAALLLAPYLAWVSFAGVLNAEIWRRN